MAGLRALTDRLADVSGIVPGLGLFVQERERSDVTDALLGSLNVLRSSADCVLVCWPPLSGC